MCSHPEPDSAIATQWSVTAALQSPANAVQDGGGRIAKLLKTWLALQCQDFAEARLQGSPQQSYGGFAATCRSFLEMLVTTLPQFHCILRLRTSSQTFEKQLYCTIDGRKLVSLAQSCMQPLSVLQLLQSFSCRPPHGPSTTTCALRQCLLELEDGLAPTQPTWQADTFQDLNLWYFRNVHHNDECQAFISFIAWQPLPLTTVNRQPSLPADSLTIRQFRAECLFVDIEFALGIPCDKLFPVCPGSCIQLHCVRSRDLAYAANPRNQPATYSSFLKIVETPPAYKGLFSPG